MSQWFKNYLTSLKSAEWLHGKSDWFGAQRTTNQRYGMNGTIQLGWLTQVDEIKLLLLNTWKGSLKEITTPMFDFEAAAPIYRNNCRAQRHVISHVEG
jgi:hypothetical protein